MKKGMRLLINRIRLRGTAAVVEWYQEGNTINIRVRRCGLFKQYTGLPFICAIDIDPTLVTQLPK